MAVAVIPKPHENVKFLKEGAKTRQQTKTAATVKTDRKWEVRVDRTLPFEIAVSRQRPDVVLVRIE